MHEAPSTIPSIVRLSLRAAEHLGYSYRILDPDYGFLFDVTSGHQTRRLLGGTSPLNDPVAARLAQDKFYTSILLKDCGFNVPEGVRCLRASYFTVNDYSRQAGPEPGIDFARKSGYPVIVKPNRMALGRDVAAVDNEADLVAAIETVWKGDYIALVQRVAHGADVRLDFLDGTFLAGYRRVPVVIVGDGCSTIRELLAAVDRRFDDDVYFGRRKSESIWNSRVVACGWNERSIIPAGHVLSFDSTVLNLNRWATADVLDDVPAPWLRFCLAVGSVTRLRHFGLDLRVPVVGDGSTWRDTPPEETVVIEVNASPALVQLHDLGYADRAIAGQARVLRAAFQP